MGLLLQSWQLSRTFKKHKSQQLQQTERREKKREREREHHVRLLFSLSPCSGEKPAMKRAEDAEEAQKREREREREREMQKGHFTYIKLRPENGNYTVR